MAISARLSTERTVEFSISELTGALGDSITVLPLLVALAMTTSVSLPHVLVAFGVFQVVWGLAYGVPLSVEPMKALAGLAIAGTLSYAELAGAGLLAGVVLIAAGRLGAVGRIQRVVGAPVVRGVQLAVALVLAGAALSLSLANPPVALASLALVGALALAGYGRASTLVVLAVGAVVAVTVAGVPTPRLPTVALFPSGAPTLSTAALEGTVAQLGMTVGNAAIATAVLCGDLYDRRLSADALSRSMGWTCLLSVPAGGIPMCHGSGGLAGKYAFGARTAGANVLLGAGYLALALVAGGAVLAAFPLALLGALLAVVAVELGRAALAPFVRFDAMRSVVRFESVRSLVRPGESGPFRRGTGTPSLVRSGDGPALALAVGVGLVGVVVNVGLAFVLGTVVYWVGSRSTGRLAFR